MRIVLGWPGAKVTRPPGVLDYPPNYGQAQPGTFTTLAALVKALKHKLLFLLRHARTLVTDVYYKPAGFASQLHTDRKSVV